MKMILLKLLILRLIKAQTWTQIIAQGCPDSAISDSSFIVGVGNHISTITMLSNSDANFGTYVHGFQINGAGTQVSLDPLPGDILETLTLTGSQRISQIVIFDWFSSAAYGYNGCSDHFSSFSVTLNDGSRKIFPETQINGTGASLVLNGPYVFSIDTCTQEIKGLMSGRALHPGNGFLENVWWYVEAITDPGVFLSLSSIQGGTKKIVSDATTTTMNAHINPVCASVTYTYAVVPNTTLISLSSNTIFSFAPSNSVADIMAYQIYYYAWDATGTMLLASTTATFSYISSCLLAYLCWTIPPINMSLSVSADTPSTQTIAVNDQNSIATATLNYCGQFQYSISSVPNTGASALTTSEIQISLEGLVSVATDNALTTGTHTVTVVGSLVSHPTIKTLSSFTLTITACIVTNVQILKQQDNGPLSSQTYAIPSASAFTLNVLVDQSPACGYTATQFGISVSSSDNPTFTSSLSSITATNGVGKYQAGPYYNLQQIGTYSVQFSSVTLNEQVVTNLTGISVFNLAITNACSTTSLDWPPTPTLSDMTYSVSAASPSTQASPIAVDGVSSSASTTGLCGQTNFLIKSVTSSASFALTASEVQISNTGLIQVLTSNPSTQGTHFVQVSAFLIFYPNIRSTLSTFTLNVNPCQVLSFSLVQHTDNGPLIAQNYPIPSSLAFTYVFQTTQTPQCGHSPTSFGISVTSTDNPGSVGSFSTISTVNGVGTYQAGPFSDLKEVGTYSVQFQSVTFNGVTETAKFTGTQVFVLSVTGSGSAVTNSSQPYFKPSLQDQVINVCPNVSSKFWSYKFPQVFDPNNATVNLRLQIDQKSFFQFDNINNILSQIQIIKNSTNFTVTATLTDLLNSTSNYSFQLRFNCSKSGKTSLLSAAQYVWLLKNVTLQLQWPSAYISSIGSDGLLKVNFNQKMKVPEHPGDIQSDTVTINGTQQPILWITVLPGKLSELKMLKFNWTFVSYTDTQMQLQLSFDFTNYVSSHISGLDQIQVVIYGIQMFADAEGNYMLPETQLPVKNLPQMISTSSLAQVQTIGTAVQQTVQTVVVSNLVVSFLISGPLQLILSAVKQLQIITHIMLINVAYPASATKFFALLMQVITFQFHDFTQFYSDTLNLDPNGQNAFTNQFNGMGYNSYYIIQNFGTLCWVILLAPSGWFFTKILAFFCKSESIIHLKTKMSRIMFFNKWIGFFNETYLFLGCCAALNTHYFYFNTAGNAFNSIVTIIFGSGILLFPLFMATFYLIPRCFKLVKNGDEEFLQRFGQAIQGLNFLRRGRIVILFPSASLVRKLWLLLTVVYMQNFPIYSIFAVNFQALIMMAIAGLTEPYCSQTANTMELVNEAFVLATNYHLFLFTDFLPDIMMREHVGQSLIATTCFNVGVNLGVVTVISLAISMRKMKLKYLEFRQASRLALKNKALLEQAREKTRLWKLKQIDLVAKREEQRQQQNSGQENSKTPVDRRRQLQQPRKDPDQQVFNRPKPPNLFKANSAKKVVKKSRLVTESQLIFGQVKREPIQSGNVESKVTTQVKNRDKVAQLIPQLLKIPQVNQTNFVHVKEKKSIISKFNNKQIVFVQQLESQNQALAKVRAEIDQKLVGIPLKQKDEEAEERRREFAESVKTKSPYPVNQKEKDQQILKQKEADSYNQYCQARNQSKLQIQPEPKEKVAQKSVQTVQESPLAQNKRIGTTFSVVYSENPSATFIPQKQKNQTQKLSLQQQPEMQIQVLDEDELQYKDLLEAYTKSYPRLPQRAASMSEIDWESNMERAERDIYDALTKQYYNLKK